MLGVCGIVKDFLLRFLFGSFCFLAGIILAEEWLLGMTFRQAVHCCFFGLPDGFRLTDAIARNIPHH